MSDTTERTFTLAEVREKERLAYRDAKLEDGFSLASAARLAGHRFPDPEPPEPERRWVTLEPEKYGRRIDVAREADGTWLWKWIENGMTRGPEPGVHYLTDEVVLALASLLPRVPVTVTEEMVEKAIKTFEQHGVGVFIPVRWIIRAALSAVASDLAQPVHACQHKAKWWGVVSDRQEAGFHLVTRDFAQAVEHCGLLNQKAQSWRVIPLAEVE